MLATRRGCKRAVLATACKMLRVIHAMLCRDRPCRDPGIDCEQLVVQRNASCRLRMLDKHGFLEEERQHAPRTWTGIPAGSASGPQGHGPGLSGPSTAGVRVSHCSAAGWSQLAAMPPVHPDSEKHSKPRAREQLGGGGISQQGCDPLEDVQFVVNDLARMIIEALQQ